MPKEQTKFYDYILYLFHYVNIIINYECRTLKMYVYVQ